MVEIRSKVFSLRSLRCSRIPHDRLHAQFGRGTRFMAVALVVASAVALAACASSTPAATSVTKATPASRGKSVSGTVVVYAALNGSGSAPLAAAFKKAYPKVKLQMVVAGSGALTARIAAQRSAGRVQADVILLANPVAMDTLAKEHVLTTWTPPSASRLPKSFRGPGWVGVFSSENIIAYRNGLKDPPTSWKSLTSPRYRGEVVIADPSYSGTTFGMVGQLSHTFGWRYFQALKANGARVEESTNTVAIDIATGADEVGITLDTFVRQLQAKGAAITAVWPKPGAIAIPRPAGVTGDATDPAAARAFVTWLLSPAGQAEGVALGYDPAMPGVASHVPASAPQMPVNWRLLAARKATILSRFAGIFGS